MAPYSERNAASFTRSVQTISETTEIELGALRELETRTVLAHRQAAGEA
ncbi:hypothetical protein [Pseudomonas sp. KU43P]|nr:hypothetical protein [Pseudomonas sp. KU43P]